MAHTTIRPVCPVSCVSCVSVWLILSSPPTTWDPFYLLSILQFGDFRSVCQFSILLSILAFNFNLFFFSLSFSNFSAESFTPSRVVFHYVPCASFFTPATVPNLPGSIDCQPIWSVPTADCYFNAKRPKPPLLLRLVDLIPKCKAETKPRQLAPHSVS